MLGIFLFAICRKYVELKCMYVPTKRDINLLMTLDGRQPRRRGKSETLYLFCYPAPLRHYCFFSLLVFLFRRRHSRCLCRRFALHREVIVYDYG